MKFNRILQADATEILNQCYSEIMDLYYSYYKHRLKEQEYYELVLELIKKSKTDYKNDIPYTDYLRLEISNSLKTRKRVVNEKEELEEYLNNHSLENNELKDNKDSEENTTSNSIKAYFNEIRSYPILTSEEEVELYHRIKNGDEKAKQRLIECNLKLVVSIARHFQNRGFPLLDLIQEGNLGLMKAVEKFNGDMGYRFSTYATEWIRVYIGRMIASKGRMIKLSSSAYEQIGKYRSTVDRLQNELGRTPTVIEIAEEMELSENDIIKIQILQDDTISLDGFFWEENGEERETFIPDESVDLEKDLMDSCLRGEVNALLNRVGLTEREKEVIKHRYGFYGEPEALEEIGRNLGITRERVRQIEMKALMKLRTAKDILSFADCTERPRQSIENIKKYQKQYEENKGFSKPFLIGKQHQQDRTKQETIEKRPLKTNIEKEVEEIIDVRTYAKLLEKLKTEETKEQMKGQRLLDSIVLGFEMGIIDGKTYSFESIADFLEMDVEEVKRISKLAYFTLNLEEQKKKELKR